MSRNILSNLLCVALGAFVGSAATWRYMKNRYENDEPFEWGEDESEKDVKEEPTEDKKEHNTVNNIIKSNSYATESTEKVKKEENSMKKIRAISPEEFQECEYPTLTLWFYTDGVVTNDDGKIVTNAYELIGSDFMEHFGEYEDDPDTVYIRNDNDGVVYEILKEYHDFMEN